MERVKIRFIINPISGGKSKGKVVGLISRYLDAERFDPEIVFSDAPGHAMQLAEDAATAGTAVVVAVGGDGTINEVATAASQLNLILAIIPFGSGNGLARFLHIPLKAAKAIALINKMKTLTIDTATLNGRPFFNTAGTGLDALIGHAFAGHRTRGLSAYIKTGLREFMNYSPKTYNINVDGKKIQAKALTIGIANSSQYGNNLHIAPKASITDGLLDVCIVRPIGLLASPAFAVNMLLSKYGAPLFIKIIRGKRITIDLPLPGFVHIDGEPMEINEPIAIEVNPLSLRVIVP